MSSSFTFVRDQYFDLTGRVALITGGGTGVYVKAFHFTYANFMQGANTV